MDSYEKINSEREADIGYSLVTTPKLAERKNPSIMNSVTQDMKYRQSLIKFSINHGVSKASRRYNKSRSYIYFWRARYDGSIESLACRSRRPHSHPNQHTEEEVKLIKDMRRRNPELNCQHFSEQLFVEHVAGI